MATSEQYAEWIVENKDKKGSPDFETVVKAYKLSKMSPRKEMSEPAFEKEARQIRDVTTPELIAGHPVTRFALGAASPILGLAQLGAEALGDKTGTETLSQLERMKQSGMRAYGTEGTDIIGIGGAVMSPVALNAMKLAQAPTIAGRIGEGIGLGAALGAATPVTEGDFGETKALQTGAGAVIGGVVPGLFEAGRAGFRLGRNVVDPLLPGGTERAVGRTLREASGGKTPEVMQALRQAPQLVPGSRPTAAEAAAPAGSAEFSALQKIAEAKRPTQFSDIAARQESARLQAIKGFGFDKETLERAIELRGNIALQDYGIAYNKMIRADPELAQLATDPYFKRALPAALDLAKSKMVNIKTNLTQFLHYAKLGMDDQLSGQARDAIGASEKQAVASVKERLVDWMARHNKPYDIARQNFAELSKPINEMKIGQELEKALTSALGTSERPAVFAGAMREAPRTIKKATGQPRYDSLAQALSPRNLEAVEGVMGDLARKSKQEQLAQAGLPRVKELVGQIEPEVPSAGMFNPAYSVTRAIANRLLGKIEGKALNKLSEVMEDPEVALRVMEMNPAQRAVFVFGVTGQKVSPTLVTVGSTTTAREIK